MSERRGRPRTRTRTALLFAAWRAVREEILVREAPNVAQACEQIIKRRRHIRIIENGAPIADITDAGKLRQWYATAERARSTDAELAIRCAAWEAQAAIRWPGVVAGRAAATVMHHEVNSGRAASQYADSFDRALAAGEHAKAKAPSMPVARKHRR